MAAPKIIARPLPLKDVTLTKGFWKDRQDINRKVTLPMELEQCRRTGRIDAFKLEWKPGQPNQPHHFWDSDLAKWIEAAAYSLTKSPDPKLEKEVDDVIDLVVAAQQPDGYLNVYYTVVKPGERWTNLRDMHELYCAGHLMEAAVAYHAATGKRKLLDCLCRYADHIASRFGPGADQKPGYCGHPEIELALVKLYRATGEKRYLDLSRFFVTQRGQSPNYFQLEAKERGETGKPWAGLDYYQAHEPLLQQKSIEGHAVRALYLLSGAIDVAAETGDEKLLNACKRLFDNCVNRRMYITGAVGSARHGERFTYDYDLPNETAYAETCANIALALAAHRMLQVDLDGRYADIMERALYNGVASGVSLKGDRFYYANPLTVADEAVKTDWGVISAKRQEWFDCACCPPNIARLLGEVNELIYSTSADTLIVNLYTGSKLTTQLAGTKVALEQRGIYPWSGAVELLVGPSRPARFTIALRIPGWCSTWGMSVNGKIIRPKVTHGYATISRLWKAGDLVRIYFEMPVRLTQTNPHCRNNAGKVAVECGPIVYCAEQVDNTADLSSYIIPLKTRWSERLETRLLGGVITISGEVLKDIPEEWEENLYLPAGSRRTEKAKLKLVPYCTWSNRKVGRMQVWFRGK